MENNLPQELRDEIKNHKTDINTLWDIYGGFKDGLCKSKYFWFSVLMSILIAIPIYFSQNSNSFFALKYLLEKVLSILPNIIGFNIGAYALIIGFGQKNIIDKMTVKSLNEKYTLFQQMGSTFAFSVLVQCVTIVIAFFADLFIFNFGELNLFFIGEISIACINGALLLIFLFFTIYSFLLIPKIVLNVFGFSQLYHFYNRRDIDENQ